MSEPRRKLTISVPKLPPSMEDKRPDLKAWDEACNAAMRKHLTQVEQDEKR